MSVGISESKLATENDLSTTSPSPTISPHGLFSLPDGRLLAYDEYGLPEGAPVLYFHDTGSSRLEAGFFDETARQQGYRLIAIDRPGIGCSDYSPSLSPLDVCQDALALADALDLERFAVMSLAAGGIFGLTLAHHHPERVCLQLSLAGVPGSVFNEVNEHSYAASCWNELTPLLIKVLVRLKHQFFADAPDQAIRRLQDHLCYTDRKTLQDPSVQRLLTLDHCEAVRSGYRGVAQDLALCYRKLNFRLQNVHVPTVIWQGSADRLSQRADCEYLAARLPEVSLHRVPNRGHYFFLQNMDRVFACLRGPSGPGAAIAA